MSDEYEWIEPIVEPIESGPRAARLAPNIDKSNPVEPDSPAVILPDEAQEKPKEPSAFLSVVHLNVSFGRQTVLRDLSLEIREKETLVIVGESGCGKTVLLKCMAGLHKPTSGFVTVQGEQLDRLSERELARFRLRMGFVFQGAALFDSLNVYENIAFGLREHSKLSDEEIRLAIRDRLHAVGLSTDIVAKMPADLSGGMRKRVGLARALVLDPSVIFYDEPTTGLDPIMSDVINELILATRERMNVTSVVVTHDMQSARKIATRMIMLAPVSRLAPQAPQILFDGPPAALNGPLDPQVRQFVHGEAGDRILESAWKD